MGADGKVIVNLFTQAPAATAGGRPGPASVKHVGHALKALAQLAVAEKWSSLALPRLATGVGGLDWNDVKPLIQQHLGALSTKVFVYATYRAGVAADEPA